MLQVTEIVSNALQLPDWTTRLVLILLLVLLPIILIFSWIFDLGPHGMVRTGDASQNQEWLGAVVWVHRPQQRDEVGNLLSKSRVALDRLVLTMPCLWRKWTEDHGVIVANNATQAIELANVINQYCSANQLPVQIGIAVGGVRVTEGEPSGEAISVAQTLALNAPLGEMRGTEQIHDELIKAPELGGAFLGQISVSALAHPVRQYRLEWDATIPRMLQQSGTSKVRKYGLVALLLVGILSPPIWYFTQSNNAAATLTVDPRAPQGKYILISPVIDEQRALSETEAFYLQKQLRRHLQYMPGIYAEEDETLAEHAYVLETRIQKSAHGWVFSARMAKENTWRPELSISEKSFQAIVLASRALTLRLVSESLGVAPDATKAARELSPDLFKVLISADLQLSKIPNHAVLTKLEETLESMDESSIRGNAWYWSSLCHVHLAKVDLYYDAQQMEKADKACNEIRASEERELESSIIYAQYFIKKGKLNEAVSELERVLKAAPKNADAYELMARIYTQQGNDLMAEHALLESVRLQPGNWRPLRNLASFQYKNGRFADAVRNYEAITQIAPRSGRAWSDTGAALLMSGKLNEAASAFLRGVQLEPSQSSYSNLGTLYYYLGRYDEAVNNYFLALKVAPEDYRLYGNLADAFRQQKNSEESRKYYALALDKLNRLVETTNSDKETECMRIVYEHYLGDEANGYERISSLLASSPDNGELQFYAALLAGKDKNSDVVLTHLEKALKFGWPSVLLSVDPDFSYLGGNSRFIQLIANHRV